MNQVEIEKIIAEFGDLIVTHKITEKDVKGGKIHTDLRLVFKDGSKMKAFFVVMKTKIQYGYSFHWMHADNTLIIRWDNTPHNHKVDTMPFHKHVETEENVQASEKMDLRKVLEYIAKVLGVLALLVWGILEKWF